ncbi:MAG: methyltransferase domain-containing protein [Bacteroidales bacterium]|nr:methyltransferase domain-containing protein [Bacteroidales bacterium]
MSYLEIDKRYTGLATESCCLSCGGAINYSRALRGEICVDLGSGRGTDVLRLAEEVGSEGFVYGIDISEGMLKKAQQTAAKMDVKNVKFIKAVLEKLPLEDRSVDLVISNCTINHAQDKQQVWNEIARILKNGGRFVVSDIYSMDEVPEKFRNDPEAIAECWAGAVTKEIYLAQLSRAGFENIEIIEESSPYSKGEIEVASFTITGKIGKCCSCSN